MITITRYKPSNKESSFQGNFDIVNSKLHDQEILEMAYFKKGINKWVSFPQKTIEENGKKKYVPYIRFKNSNITKKFLDEVLKALEEHFQINGQGYYENNQN